MLELSRKKAMAAFAGAAIFTLAPVALGVDCSALGLPRPIYGAGGSAETQVIRAVAIYLANLPDPISVFWHDPGACDGYKQYVTGGISGTAVKYWSATGAALTCSVAVTENLADFSHMGNDHGFCIDGGFLTEADLPSGYPDGFGEVPAPVQTANIVVDKDSSRKSISAEALYYIFGFGAGAAGKSVTPWNNPAHILTRSPTSFLHQFIALSVFGDAKRSAYDDPGKNGQGDTAGGFNGRLGFRGGDQAAVINQINVIGNSSPETPIGYVSGSAVIADETAEGGRKAKVLAYQHYDQACGYWPDSTESSKDKINVRTGKYHFWAPGHFFARTDENGDLVNSDVAAFINAIVTPENPETLGLVIDNGDVPLCAMQVTREGLVGAISSVAPEDPCGCFFESRVAGTAQCDSCDDDNDCSEPGAVCRRNYCEAY